MMAAAEDSSIYPIAAPATGCLKIWRLGGVNITAGERIVTSIIYFLF